MIQQLQRPARLVVVLAATCVLLLWLVHLQHSRLECDLPVVVQHFDAPPPQPMTPGPTPAPTLSSPPKKLSKIAKVTVAANNLKVPVVHRALKSHQVQNEMHGYLQFIGENEVVSDVTENDPFRRPSGAYTKPAYLLSVIVAELQKPEDERLEWI